MEGLQPRRTVVVAQPQEHTRLDRLGQPGNATPSYPVPAASPNCLPRHVVCRPSTGPGGRFEGSLFLFLSHSHSLSLSLSLSFSLSLSLSLSLSFSLSISFFLSSSPPAKASPLDRQPSAGAAPGGRPVGRSRGGLEGVGGKAARPCSHLRPARRRRASRR